MLRPYNLLHLRPDADVNDALRSLFTGECSDRFIHVVQIKLVRADLAQWISAGCHQLQAQFEGRKRRALDPLHGDELAAESTRSEFLDCPDRRVQSY